VVDVVAAVLGEQDADVVDGLARLVLVQQIGDPLRDDAVPVLVNQHDPGIGVGGRAMASA
jgi:hypothetical protein